MRLTLDVETYFDSEYSLRNKKLPMVDYIHGESFEMLVLAYAYDDEPVASVQGHDAIADWIKSQDWPNITAIAHNAAFDLGIASFLFGVSPGKIIDTMALSRGVFGPAVKHSLSAVAARLGLPKKTINYVAFKGKHFADLPPAGRRHLAAGCERDTELTRIVARRLEDGFPLDELVIIDQTVRMFTQPVLCGDFTILEEIAETEKNRKLSAQKTLGVERRDLTSSKKFVGRLEECGVEVEYKAGKHGDIPAIAKTDAFMQDLRALHEHDPDNRAAQLVMARLDVKSGIDEDRARRLAAMAARGALPVPLNYCGAATTRFSGGGGVNWQNLPNARTDRDLKLRGTIMAPGGHLLVIADFSQVEFRLLCALAEEEEQLDALRDATRDVYREFGEAYLYQVSPISQDQRNFSKRVKLGCGYGMGHVKFAKTCQDDGQPIELQAAKIAVEAFRRAHPAIVRFWKGKSTESLRILANEDPQGYRLGPVGLKGGAVYLPNGLRCPFVLEHDGNGGFLRTDRYGQKSYWGGSFAEFLCQSLSRVLLTDLLLRVQRELGFRPALHVHDEVVYAVPEADAEAVKNQLIAWMSESPLWFPGLPLKGEGWIGKCYKKG